MKDREEEEEKAVKKTEDEGAHEAAYEDQGDQGWIPVSPRRRKQNEQVTTDDHWAGPGLPLGYARKGRICDHTDCLKIIDDHTYRLYPTYCSKCLEVWIKVQERFRFSEYSHV